jgi:5S rRNA maturation endonuclease (ribonuclease M5)
MASLIYSANALNTLRFFHGNKKVIYVEGKDDLPFWEKIFSIFNFSDVAIKPSGGIQELKKIEAIARTAGSNVFIARDTDYELILGKISEHPKVLRTYGHSIENTMYSPKNIAKAIALHLRIQEFKHELVTQWIDSFLDAFKYAIAFDITNESLGSGHKVLGDSCCPFLNDDGKSCSPNVDKIEKLLVRMRSHIPDVEVQKIEASVNSCGLSLRYVIRGHFLTNAVINFIKKQVKSAGGKSPSLNPDGLYMLLLAQLHVNVMDTDDVYHLSSEVKKLN